MFIHRTEVGALFEMWWHYSLVHKKSDVTLIRVNVQLYAVIVRVNGHRIAIV